MPLYSDVLLLDPRVKSKPTSSGRISGAQQLFSIAIGLNAFFELVTSGFLGVLCDRIGRRPVALLTQVGQFVDYTATAFCAPAVLEHGYQVHSIGAAVIIARSVAGLCGNIKVPLQGYVADISLGGTAARNFGYLGIAVGFALVAGPALSLVVIRSTNQMRIAIGTAACLSLINILIICCTWVRSTPVQVASWREANPYWLLRNTVMRTRRLQIFGWMNFLDALALNVMLSTIPLFTKSRFDWTPFTLSLFFLVVGLLTPFQMCCVMSPLLKRRGEVFVLKLGYGATCVAYVSMFLVGLTDAGTAFFGTTLAFTLGLISNPTQTGMAIRELPPEEYGRLSGGLSLLETLGKVLAPCVGGMLLTRGIQWDCPSLVYLVAAVVMMPGIALAFLLEVLNRRSVIAPPQVQPQAAHPKHLVPSTPALMAAAAATAGMADTPDSSCEELPAAAAAAAEAARHEDNIMSI